MKADIPAETPANVPFHGTTHDTAFHANAAAMAHLRAAARARVLVDAPEGVVHHSGATGAAMSGDSDRAPSAKPRF